MSRRKVLVIDFENDFEKSLKISQLNMEMQIFL